MKTNVTIVGGGACALMLACELDPGKFKVSLYEKNAALGRKFLVAGEGGLNLTHSENKTQFIRRYQPASFLEEAFFSFSNTTLVEWLAALGVPTYTGSSGRIFPRAGIKPIEVLNAFLARIKERGVSVFTRHTLMDVSQNALHFEHAGEIKKIQSELVIFCMGGASWPVTGSTGDWEKIFRSHQVKTNPFQASNCSFKIDWSPDLISKIEGKVLKNISIRCDHKIQAGEVVLTKFGLEGSGIYPFSPEIRRQLMETGQATIVLDLKPGVAFEKIKEKLEQRAEKVNLTTHLKTGLHLSDIQVVLLKHYLSKEQFLDNDQLSQAIKSFALQITGTGPIDDAISTVGGIDLSEIDEHFALKKMPGYFAIGEMLDYDAPTGGYLLQSCFSMANFLARHLNGA